MDCALALLGFRVFQYFEILYTLIYDDGCSYYGYSFCRNPSGTLLLFFLVSGFLLCNPSLEKGYPNCTMVTRVPGSYSSSYCYYSYKYNYY